MKQAKVILALLLSVMMVIGMVACGDKPAETTAPETTKEVAETTTVPETTTEKAPETTTAPETTAEQGPHTAHTWAENATYTAYADKAADGSIGYMAIRCTAEGCKAVKNNTYTPVYAYYDFEKVPTAAELPTITVVGSADGVSYVLKEGADSAKNEIEITSAARYFYAASNTGLSDYIKKSGDKFVCRTNVGFVENGVLTPSYNIFDVGTKFLFDPKEVTELTFDVDIEFEKISGSATGGNTLLGLSRRKANADSSPASLILHSRKDASGTVIPGEAVLKFSKSETKGLTDELGNEIIIKDGETHHFTLIIDSGKAWTFSVKMDGKLLYRDDESAIAMSTGGANYANGFVLGNAVGTVHMDNIVFAAANAVKNDDLCECGSVAVITTEIPATCTEGGSLTVTCAECGKTTTTTTEATGHKYAIIVEPEEVVLPTATNPFGYLNRVCMNCGETLKVITGFLPHEHAWGEVTYEEYATPAADGSIGRLIAKCSVRDCEDSMGGDGMPVYVKLDFDKAPEAKTSADIDGVKTNSVYTGGSAENKPLWDEFLYYIDQAKNVSIYTGFEGSGTYSGAGVPGIIKAEEEGGTDKHMYLSTKQLYIVDDLALASKESKVTDFYIGFDVLVTKAAITFGYSARKVNAASNNIPSQWMIFAKTVEGTDDHANDFGLNWYNSGKEVTDTSCWIPKGSVAHILLHVINTEETHEYSVSMRLDNEAEYKDYGTYKYSSFSSTSDEVGKRYEFMFKFTNNPAAGMWFDNLMFYGAAPVKAD